MRAFALPGETAWHAYSFARKRRAVSRRPGDGAPSGGVVMRSSARTFAAGAALLLSCRSISVKPDDVDGGAASIGAALRDASPPSAARAAAAPASGGELTPARARSTDRPQLDEVTPILRVTRSSTAAELELWLDVPELALSERLTTFTPEPPLVCGTHVYSESGARRSDFVGVTCSLTKAPVALTRLRVDDYGELVLGERSLGKSRKPERPARVGGRREL